jgi:hypothetical protein
MDDEIGQYWYSYCTCWHGFTICFGIFWQSSVFSIQISASASRSRVLVFSTLRY